MGASGNDSCGFASDCGRNCGGAEIILVDSGTCCTGETSDRRDCRNKTGAGTGSS
jgi:hypothetical protein